MVVDISGKRLELAAQYGFATCNSATEDLKSKAIEVFGATRGLAGEVSDCDLYVDAVGAQPILDNFQQIAKVLAKLSVVGVYHEPASLNMVMLCYMNWRLGGCGRSPLEELVPEIVEMIQSKQYDISKMISHEYKIDDFEDAIKMACNSAEALKVAIRYE
jgi:threonine dehydrogenase-like Zn-dependent dehydrogenase